MHHRIHRILLCVLCIAVIGGVVAGASPAGSNAAAVQEDGDRTYAVTQGDQCIDVRPLGNGSQTVEEFYDYRTPETHEYPDYTYSSYGTTHLQEDDTSIFFFYEGREGTSLVLVHDRLEGNSSGAAITMEFEGLPEEGEWVVEDDDYSEDHYGGPFDEFAHGETSSRITWAYTDNRTDGAAFRGGLDDDVEITIDPAFNDSADFRVYEGNITDWQVLSATDDDEVERTSLQSLEEQVTIRSGSCPSMAVTTVTTSSGEVEPGETLDIQSTVVNDGSVAETFTVPVTVNGETIDEHEVTLEAGERRQLTTSTSFEEEGTYEIAVAETTITVEVVEDESTGESGDDNNGSSAIGSDESDGPIPGFGVGHAIASAVLAAVLVGLSRRE